MTEDQMGIGRQGHDEPKAVTLPAGPAAAVLPDAQDAATHEAAHCVAGILAGRTLLSVEVRGIAGITGWARGPEPRTRDEVDMRIIELLAGDTADRLLWPGVGRLDETPPPGALEAILTLPARYREAVEATYASMAADRLDDEHLDDSKAAELAFALRGAAAGAYLAWLRLEAERFVRDHAGLIFALRDVLRERRFLTGPEAESIVHSYTERSPDA